MRYIALLRGINVGGNTMVKMADLKASFENLGFTNVVTYINSGNIAFDTTKTSEARLVSKLEAAVEALCQRKVQVMVRERSAIPDILANNPFEGEYESHKEMHVLFLRDPIPPSKVEELRAGAPAGERFEVKGREIYCHLPQGVADSYLGRGQFEKKLKISITARNWRTVEKLAEL
jgi:uncharacterized protein (DUF1697 family)